MSLRVSCRRTQAPPRILSRNLRIGVGSHVVRSEAPVKHHGLPGWRQTFDAGAEGGAVRVATVTLIDGPCTVDFAFSARDHFEASAPDFERWWTSYRPARASTQELPP